MLVNRCVFRGHKSTTASTRYTFSTNYARRYAHIVEGCSQLQATTCLDILVGGYISKLTKSYYILWRATRPIPTRNIAVGPAHPVVQRRSSAPLTFQDISRASKALTKIRSNAELNSSFFQVFVLSDSLAVRALSCKITITGERKAEIASQRIP